MVIGLEYIAKTFGMEFKTIAKEIDVTPQQIQDWLKLRRKIPERRLQDLSELFVIGEKYFQKELSNSEKIEIQMIHIQRMDKENEFETELFHLQKEHEKEQLLSKIAALIDHEEEEEYKTFNYRMFREVTEILQQEDKSKNTILESALYYRLYYQNNFGYRSEYHWLAEKPEFFKEFETLLLKHKII